MFKLLHFNGSESILKKKRMVKDVEVTMEYIDDVLAGALYKRELFRQALDEMDWIAPNGDMNILEGRRYRWKGLKKSIAIEGNFSAYEYILEGLFRLQLGFEKKKIEMGILILTAKRSEKSPYGSTEDMVREEMTLLEPVINLPVAVALFNLEDPVITDGEGGDEDGVSVPTNEDKGSEKVTEAPKNCIPDQREFIRKSESIPPFKIKPAVIRRVINP